MQDKTLRQHLSNAAKARWAKTTKKQRSEHAKKMVDAREAKRKQRKEATIPESGSGEGL